MHLDEMLKNFMHISEIRELVDKTMAEQAAIKSIDLEELDDLPAPESMNTEELRELLPRLDKLQGSLYDSEPEDEDSEEYEVWSDGLSYILDLMDNVESVLAKWERSNHTGRRDQ